MTEIKQEITEVKKYRNIIVDTVNGLMNDEFLASEKKPGFDEWRSYSINLLKFYDFCKNVKIDTIVIQILGYEATGKTVGGSFLNPDETVWLNIDKKPLTFTGARKMYPPDNSKKNYARIIGYDEAKTKIKQIADKSKEPLIIFMLGHLEDYKAAGNILRQRLKVLGKMATKENIEGSLAHTYYTSIDEELAATDPNRYRLRTVTTGYDTARSPMGLWDTEFIPNNFQLIVDKILADY